MIAPAFVLLWAWRHYGVRAAATTTALFTAGLLLVVAPYTARNYAATHRFIPVNCQASFALWATSLDRIPPGHDYLSWLPLWFEDGMATYSEVTGASAFSLVVFEDHVLELSDRFQEMAWNNLRTDPAPYSYNVVHNTFRFLVDVPTVFWLDEYFDSRQLHGPAARFVASLSLTLMAVVSLIALILGCVRREPKWTMALALFGVMWASHSLTFLEPRYLYVKLPTVFIGFVLALVGISTSGHATVRRAAAGFAMLVAALSIIGAYLL